MKTLQRSIAIILWCVTLFAAHAGADTITYFQNDLLGSPAAATNESGTVIWREAYSGYGERIKNEAPSAPNKVWYTSRHQDADTGLVYMGARYYDPALGRFLSVDAVGFNEQNVHSFNRYAYANNNPYRFKDPDGLNAVTAVGGLLIESYNFAMGDGFNGSMVWGALKDGYNGEGAGVWRSAGEDALSFAGGALGAAAKGVRNATGIAATAKELNQIAHVFPRLEKGLEGLVRASGGSQLDALRAVQASANQALAEGTLVAGANGVLPGNGLGAILSVNGVNVQLIGGRVMNGAGELGSFVGL